ncbi:MAG: hypothetical protein Q8R82_08635 [Hyphomonadaceae bacterium]|nr:hypothetical protein [Hyphomonadaceae bacterium]
MCANFICVNEDELSPAVQELLYYVYRIRRCFSRMAFATELDGHLVRASDGTLQQPNAIVIEWTQDRHRKYGFLIEGDNPESRLPTNDAECTALLERLWSAR